jgi:glycosyltransferase involved in cell wall biosynthesis
MPEVSVIVALHNQERYLAQSVRSALNQSFRDLEVIIVDDASTDGSLNDALALRRESPDRVRVLHNKTNRGVSRTRNRGASHARGGILAFLDADDYWLPDKLRLQVDAFCSDPGLGLCHSGVQVECDEESASWARERRGIPKETFNDWAKSFDGFCRAAESFSQPDYFTRLIQANNICLSSAALRKNVFERAGGFVDGKKCQSEDWLLWIKVSMFARIRAIARPLTVYRFHPQSHTAKVLMGKDFNFAKVREEVIQAAQAFDPERFARLMEHVHTCS